MSELTRSYRGVTLTYDFDMFVGEVPADQYGAWTFTLNNIKYAYPEYEEATAKIDELLFVKDEAEQEDTAKKEEDLAKEIEDRVEVTEFVVPALPWYAAWLQPVLEYIGSLTKAVVDFITPILAPIDRAADYIADMPLNLIDRLTGSIKNIYDNARLSSVDKANQTMVEIGGEAAPWRVQLEAQLMTMVEPLIKSFIDETSPEKYEESLVSPEESIHRLNLWRANVVGSGLVTFIFHSLLEAGTLGQMEAVGDFKDLVIDSMGLQPVANKVTMLPFEKGLLKQAEKFYNQKYLAEIPSVNDLINMVVKDKLTVDEFIIEMKNLGFNEDWSNLIWDAHFIQPSYGEIRASLYRGIIKPEEWPEAKIRADLDPFYDKIWDGLLEQIPPYQEIVNQRTKEVIDADQFKTNLQWLGFDEKQADRIWQAHFIPPSLGDLLTSWRRGEISEARLDELMLIVDLDPRFKDIFDTRKYDDPSVTMGRFMFETGAIDIGRVSEIVKRAGYFPEDIPEISDYIIRFQERLWRRRYIVQVQRAYEFGVRTEEELKAEIEAANYTDGVAHWMIEASNLRNEMKAKGKVSTRPKLLNLGDLKKLYETDRLSEDEFRTDLMMHDYDTGEVEKLILLMNDKKVVSEAGGRKLALSESQWLNAWRYGEATEDEIRIEFQLRGLEEDHVDKLINTKKIQWEMVE